MKKFLNFLLILSLIAGVGMGLPRAVNAEGANAEGTNTSSGGKIGVRQSVGDPGVVKNYYNPMFYIAMVRPEDGMVDFAVNSAGTDLYLHRVILAYYNYEDGVSEEEADAQIGELGATDGLSWGTKVYDFAQNAFPQNTIYGGGAKVFDETGTMTMEPLSLAEVSKTDVLYYAAEFGEKSGSGLATTWSNTSWVRGKIDYRDCIHGSNYTNYGECKVVRTADSEVANYWTYGRKPATDVHIMTWDEEWQGIQKKRLEPLETKITDWEKLEDFSTVDATEIAEVEADLGRLKKTLAKTGGEGTQALRDLRDNLEARLKKLQGIENVKPEENGTESGAKPGEENGTGNENGSGAGIGNGDGNENGNENGNGAGSGSSLGGRDEFVVRGGSAVNGMSTSSDAVGGVTAYNGAQTESQGADNEDLVAQSGQGNETDNKTNDGDQEVEIPNLGGTERQKMTAWVFYLPLIAGLLLLVLVLARKIYRKVRGNDLR